MPKPSHQISSTLRAYIRDSFSHDGSDVFLDNESDKVSRNVQNQEISQFERSDSRQSALAPMSMRAQAQEPSSTRERVNPFPEDVYESLTLMTQRHNTMLEQYREQERTSQRLSREMEALQERMRAMSQAQQDQFERVQQQEELQRAANDRASKLEANVSTLASHVIDLRKELDNTVRNMTAHQRDMTEVMTELTQELHQMRIGAYQPQSCPQEDALSSMGNKPTKTLPVLNLQT